MVFEGVGVIVAGIVILIFIMQSKKRLKQFILRRPH